ncbi:hypothetical protein CIW49_16300 [Mycolicibacterium sp. P1-18]|uniref:lipopolysaccharide biosynthesis protein n=1 Tax=Mycolicibacterium sp. P1-18 TaxID=2024615 RepID=UPI0011F2E1BC|nr:polysaccharide biosynthesis C-terminal domain-containing protein [Mycolicibacterium sp. P1-18]KAA0097448.1 hypothetical protein CIW49_16300 [Mycolicibacterium sp. P1-18]
MSNPLLRNGHLLTLSSALVAVTGLCFWTTAAWEYDASVVGSNSAAVSMLMLLVSISQLNLSSAVVRFVPAAGRHTKALIGSVLIVAGGVALLVGVCAVSLVHVVSPTATFFDGTTAQAIFVVATVASTIFVIQEGVLAGLRRTALVPLTNFVFALGKLGLVVAFSVSLPSHGILAAWALSAAGIVIAINVFLFWKAIPRQQRTVAADSVALPPLRHLIHFVTLDYGAAICSVAAMTTMPMLVLAALGATQNAYFSMAWLIGTSVFQISLNMGVSLVVESSSSQSDLARQARHVLVHTGKLLVAVVLVIIVAAPYLLGVFGTAYREADDTLRIFALSALPHLVVVTGISSARAQRRMKVVLWTQIPQAALTIPLTWFLLPRIGMEGASVAWLITISMIACGLMIRKDSWLTIPIRSGVHP